MRIFGVFTKLQSELTMKKHKENLFAEKFRLLNSQESQEITWTSSDSSDFDNFSLYTDKLCNVTNKRSRKRKRKRTVPKNISNLDITILNGHNDTRDKRQKPKVKTEVDYSEPKSPILGSTQYFSPYKCKDISSSPIITLKTDENQSKFNTSPILVLKTASPKISPHIRKKLFKSEKIVGEEETKDPPRRDSSVLNDTYSLDCRKNNSKIVTNQRLNKKKLQTEDEQSTSDMNKITLIKHESLTQRSKILESLEEIKILETQKTHHVINETPEISNMDDSVSMLKTSSIDLAKKVQSYFDCHFSSDNASQNTISEISTPKNNSKSSDDIEIISSITQVSNKISMESIKQEAVDENKKEKKIRYKKDGLASRLNLLLKKQTASISLWHHEKFLAANSNFCIPKGEFIAFRISKSHFKYGCYLLEAMDISDNNFLILINSSLKSTDIIQVDSILKLYEPYKIVDFNENCKYIINVVKFECVNIKE